MTFSTTCQSVLSRVERILKDSGLFWHLYIDCPLCDALSHHPTGSRNHGAGHSSKSLTSDCFRNLMPQNDWPLLSCTTIPVHSLLWLLSLSLLTPLPALTSLTFCPLFLTWTRVQSLFSVQMNTLSQAQTASEWIPLPVLFLSALGVGPFTLLTISLKGDHKFLKDGTTLDATHPALVEHSWLVKQGKNQQLPSYAHHDPLSSCDNERICPKGLWMTENLAKSEEKCRKANAAWPLCVGIVHSSWKLC